MRQFKTVFKFEYTNYIKSKSFIVMTAVMLLIALIAGNVPVIRDVYRSVTNQTEESGEEQTQSGDLKKAAILADTGIYTKELLSTYFSQYDWVLVGDLNGIEDKITDGEYEVAVKINGLNYTVYQKGSNTLFSSVSGFSEMIRSVYQQNELAKAGLSAEQINGVLSAAPVAEYIAVGKDASQSFWIGYAMIFLLYMTVVLYGQFVLTSVVTEKTSKAMELLITSAKPIHLIFGKVIGTGLAGLTQFGLFTVTAFVVLKLNAAGWSDLSPTVGAIVDLSLSSGLFLYAVLFFLFGFFMFAFIYAGVGSTVSRMEDANSAVMLPVLLLVAAFMVSITGLTTPEAMYVKVCSYVPFLSPMVMFMRICSTDMPVIEIILGIVLNALYVLGAGYVSTKIYRVGVMLYGAAPKLKDIIRYIREA